ncbi:hypothetical protein GGQ86_000782 [Xanthobacter flavus]|uniref:PIN domain-containing protein n=1 Tax=Xanthobacter flavus TaxID=281 RepID=A0A9W6FJ61_XANFL|nr:hypothetical protein [Xanthobacter flavus]MDR6332335.1 hypothetical protein [Xanthobacter flavus]GLI21916.1 hypothetical protein XFLAVUS301_15900 [Xanthobacter flavus]
MTDGILLDNDVVLKACAYRCQNEVIERTTLGDVPPAMLRIARYTLLSILSRPCGVIDLEGATAALYELLPQVQLLDPTETEIELAAEFEELAMSNSFSFDSGESQLVAILILRNAALLITGDKRAIAALAGIAPSPAEGRIACFEQLAALLLAKYSHEQIRLRVCSEAGADKAISICFSCKSEATSSENILAGLASYIRDLRSKTGHILIDDAILLSKVP